MNLRILILFLLIIPGYGFSQTFSCVDSTRIRYGGYCQPVFMPVCGCNNETYRNQCFAINAGVLSYSNEICENVAIDLNPNPVISEIKVSIATRYGTPVNLYLVDFYGKFYLNTTLPASYLTEFNYDMQGHPYGLYTLIAETGGQYVFRKFVKYTH